MRFSPIALFLLIFRPARSSLWVGTNPRFLGVGLVLAGVSLLVFCAVSVRSPLAVMQGIGAGLDERGLLLLPLIVHIFFEDLIIVLLGSRLMAVCKRLWIAAVITASLFALAHVPALLDGGIEAAEIGSLMLDTTLGVCVFIALARTRDLLWFWPVHVVMDLTQFAS